MDTRLSARPEYRPLPPPSKLEIPAGPLPGAPPAFVIRAALALRRFFQVLADAVVPAQVALFEHSTAIANTALLGAIARHDIADFLEQNGPSTAEAIARARGLNADALHRTLRALSTMGIFAMSSDGAFSNNRMSRELVGGRISRAREWALYFSSGSNASAWLDYARTLETGESAFTHLHGENVWEWFDSHPDEREMFAHCMMGLTVMEAPAIASMYPFREVTRLCDVGGGRGTLLSEIVKRHPNVKGVLYDGPGVIESARQLLASRGLTDRVELAAGSFFEKVPSGCDAYLMKNILHDWDDPTCTELLRIVRKAAAPGARMLVCELLVERNSREGFATRADLQMMIACHKGRERGLREIQGLLEAAGFQYRRVFRGATASVVEGVAV